MTRIVFALMWLVRLLPLPAIAVIGNALGVGLYWLIPERRRVTRVNLEKCFPDMSPAARERLARASFRAFCRSFVERAILWWSSEARLRRLIRIEGEEHLEALAGRPVIVLAPHFAGTEHGGTRLALDRSMASMYSHQKDPALDRLLYEKRRRFGGELFARQDSLRKVVRAIRSGAPFYYLPDMDLGRSSAVFVPFFGVPAATVTGLSDLARLAGAAVVPCVTRMLPGGGGYIARLYPAWQGFPSGDDAGDARRMLAFIEERVLEMPEQYLWMHKRFKTRPEGEPRFY
ncbi:MAG TPA: lipid A biosynthesis acyltransferase [Burkholderiales bacterium]|nr:lipid A biosynthesis acyltransferase [Burkholderiales bacterium]